MNSMLQPAENARKTEGLRGVVCKELLQSIPQNHPKRILKDAIDNQDSMAHSEGMKTNYPMLVSLKLTNEQIRSLVTVSETVAETVKDAGAVFPEPKGYDVVEVDATLTGKPVRFTTHRPFC